MLGTGYGDGRNNNVKRVAAWVRSRRRRSSKLNIAGEDPMQVHRAQRLRQAARRITGAVLIALVVLSAAGQVRRSQEGSELDANYRVGRRGYNNFRRQSVGLSDVVGGNPFAPSPYYERTTTILDLDRLKTGGSIPGSNTPSQFMIGASVHRRLYEEATAGYTPLMDGVGPGRMLAVPSAGQPGARPFADSGVPSRPLGAETLFRIARSEDRRKLVEELLQMEQGRRSGQATEEAEEGEPDGRIRSEVDSRVTEIQPVPVPPPTMGEPVEGAPEATEEAQPGQAEPLEQVAEAQAGPAQDVYLELLYGLRRQRGQEHRRAETVAEENLQGFSDDEAPAIPTKPTPLRQRSGAVELLPGGGLVLHRLAGVSPDRFNRYMTVGEEKLKAGGYYEAAEQYELAMTIDAANPLARAGMGLALFAAGEPLSAATHLRRAMQLLPPMMETRLDLLTFLDAEAIELRTADLEARLADARPRDEPLLRFLATVIHRDLGHQEQARQHAGRLKEIAGDDKLMAAFAEFVLTGKRPGEQPPASGEHALPAQADTSEPPTSATGR